jgi:hypothetical protein
MLAPKSTFQPETVALMGRVFDAAWREIQPSTFSRRTTRMKLVFSSRIGSLPQRPVANVTLSD